MMGTTRLRALTMFLWIFALAAPAGAETVYVADRFEIGVHDDTNIDSVILAVIASGTPLTVIARNGNFVEVSTPDGIKGWVDTRYIVSEKPSVTLLDEQNAKLQNAARRLGDARAEVEVLRQRISELQRDAATAAHVSAGIAKPISLAPNEDSAKLKEAQHALENLAEENRQLSTRITDLEAMRVASMKSATESEVQEQEGALEKILHGPVRNEARTWNQWQWLMFGSILLLAFAAGGYMVDWESRRRHGGFRI